LHRIRADANAYNYTYAPALPNPDSYADAICNTHSDTNGNTDCKPNLNSDSDSNADPNSHAFSNPSNCLTL
jgi:hypothetical protein